MQLTLAKPVTTTLHKRHGGGAIGGERDDTLLGDGPRYYLYGIQACPLTVTPLGTSKMVTISGVSLYRFILIIR